VSQHVDGAAPRDLALQSRQELAARRSVLVQRQRLGAGLSLAQEGSELRQVHALLAVVVFGCTADPARAVASRPLVHRAGRADAGIAGRTGQRRADQPFEAALAGVGGIIPC
jgi:hypothetical protein